MREIEVSRVKGPRWFACEKLRFVLLAREEDVEVGSRMGRETHEEKIRSPLKAIPFVSSNERPRKHEAKWTHEEAQALRTGGGKERNKRGKRDPRSRKSTSPTFLLQGWQQPERDDRGAGEGW